MKRPRGEVVVSTTDPDVKLWVEVYEDGVFLETYRDEDGPALAHSFVSYQAIADAFL